MANDTDITFTIGFDVDKVNQKEAFNKMSSSFTNYPLAKVSRSEKKELDAFVARHNEEIAKKQSKTIKDFILEAIKKKKKKLEKGE